MRISNKAGNLLPIYETNGEPTVDSREVAKGLGVQHKNSLETLQNHQKSIEKDFGLIAFETLKSDSQRGKPTRIANLTEGQAIALVTLSKNTERSVALKLKLAKSFLYFRQMAYELASKNNNLVHIAESVVMSVIPSDKHVFLVTTKEFSRAAKISVSTINANKHRYKQTLLEDVHFINDFVVKDDTQNLEYKTTVWTQKGVIEQSTHFRVGNAVAFRDWSDRIQNKMPRNLAMRDTKPKKRKHNRLTPERIISIMADVSRIENRQLRESLSDKITEGYV